MERIELKIFLLNVDRWKKGAQSNFKQIESLIKTLRPDIIVLNEVFGQGWLNYVEKIAKHLGENYSVYFGPTASPSYGNAFITNQKIVKSENFTIELPRHEIRGCFRVVIRHPTKQGQNISFYGTHLDHIFEETRMEQLKYLLEKVVCDEEHVILGDFNALKRQDYSDEYWEEIFQVRKQNCWEVPPKTEVIEFIQQKNYVDFFQEINQQKSEPLKDRAVGSSHFDTRVDYIWISEKLLENIYCENSSCTILREFCASDHYPQWAVLVFK